MWTFQTGRFIRQSGRLILGLAIFVAFCSVGVMADEPPPDATGATHQQTKIIHLKDGDLRLACFCLTKDGRIVAALSEPDQPTPNDQPDNRGESGKQAKDEKPSASGALQLLDPDGKLLKQWSLDFTPQAVGLGPNDTLYLAGNGVLARFDMSGKQLARAESPQVVAARKDPKGLEKRARAMLDDQRNQFKSIIENLKSEKEELAKKDEKSLTDEEKSTKATIDQQIQVYKEMDSRQSKEITDADMKNMMAQITQSDRRVNAIAAGTNYVYTTTRTTRAMDSEFGGAIWISPIPNRLPQA